MYWRAVDGAGLVRAVGGGCGILGSADGEAPCEETLVWYTGGGGMVSSEALCLL